MTEKRQKTRKNDKRLSNTNTKTCRFLLRDTRGINPRPAHASIPLTYVRLTSDSQAGDSLTMAVAYCLASAIAPEATFEDKTKTKQVTTKMKNKNKRTRRNATAQDVITKDQDKDK